MILKFQIDSTKTPKKHIFLHSVYHQKHFDKKCRVTSSQSFYQTKILCNILWCTIGSEPQLSEKIYNILRKKACGIKTIYCLRNCLPTKIRILLLNALFISHLHYSTIHLNGISQSLISTLEKQVNWGVKACFI